MQNIINYFQIEGLNIILAVTGLVVTIFTMLTAKTQIKSRRQEYYLLSMFFMISFLVVIFTNNWLIFIIAWEIVTISTALMLLWKNRGLAGQYFIIQFLGSSILIYFILLAYKNGYYEIMPISEIWLQNLFILGLGMKSAIFGLHFWLPAVHSQAPAPVSALLSGWVVKLGFITYLKIIPEGNIFLLILGFLMIFYGGKKAFHASDYKVLLAYSSISQLGYIAVGIGSGTVLGVLGSIFHIIAHSLAKTGLFIGSGYLLEKYESRNIYDFKGVFKRSKVINMSILTGFFSLMGFPLLAGFNSKYLIKHGFFADQAFKIKKISFIGGLVEEHIFIIAIYAASLVTSLYSVRFLYWGLFKDLKEYNIRRGENNISDHKSAPAVKNSDKNNSLGQVNGSFFSDRVEIFILSITSVLLFLFPFYLIPLLNRISNIHLHFNYFNGFIEFMFILFIALIILYKGDWYEIARTGLPSLDFLFNKINKVLHRTARFLYNIIYLDFQYQLLWIPLFLVLLFIWLNI